MQTIYTNLEVIGRVLIRTFFIGYVVLFLWLGMYMLPHQSLCNLINTLYGMSASQCVTFNLWGMTFLKLLLFTFFLAPWLAIRWVLKGSKA